MRVLHLGSDYVLTADSIVGIFDIETSTLSKRTREFLERAQQAGQLISPTDDLPKSFIVCKGKLCPMVYLSSLSSATLKKRFSQKYLPTQ